MKLGQSGFWATIWEYLKAQWQSFASLFTQDLGQGAFERGQLLGNVLIGVIVSLIGVLMALVSAGATLEFTAVGILRLLKQASKLGLETARTALRENVVAARQVGRAIRHGFPHAVEGTADLLRGRKPFDWEGQLTRVHRSMSEHLIGQAEEVRGAILVGRELKARVESHLKGRRHERLSGEDVGRTWEPSVSEKARTETREGELIATPDNIRVGTLQYDLHPGFPAIQNELNDLGYNIVIHRGNAAAAVHDILDEKGNVLRTEKKVYIREFPSGNKMAFLDLEHEMDHVRDWERIRSVNPNWVTDRFIESEGVLMKAPTHFGNMLTLKNNEVSELHVRIREYLRLKSRHAPDSLLKDHESGVREWLAQFNRRQRFQSEFEKDFFPNVRALIGEFHAATK